MSAERDQVKGHGGVNQACNTFACQRGRAASMFTDAANGLSLERQV